MRRVAVAVLAPLIPPTEPGERAGSGLIMKPVLVDSGVIRPVRALEQYSARTVLRWQDRITGNAHESSQPRACFLRLMERLAGLEVVHCVLSHGLFCVGLEDQTGIIRPVRPIRRASADDFRALAIVVSVANGVIPGFASTTRLT